MSSLDCLPGKAELNICSSTRESKECLLLRRYKCCRLGEGYKREDRSATSRNPRSEGFWFDSDTRIANKDRTRTSVLVCNCLSRTSITEEFATCFPGSGKLEFGFLFLDCTDAKTTIDCKQRIWCILTDGKGFSEGYKREDGTRSNLSCRSRRFCSVAFKSKQCFLLTRYEGDCLCSTNDRSKRTRTSIVTLTKGLSKGANELKLQTLRFKTIIWEECAVILMVVLIVLIYITIIDLVWYSSKLRDNFISKRTDRIVEISRQCWRFLDVVDRLTDESIIITFTYTEGRFLIIVEGDSLCSTIEVTKRSRSNFAED